jgi:hypothetical protein
MIKVVKRPKEYIAIKVPRTCEDVGKFVSNEAEKAGIQLDITAYYADGKKIWTTKVGVKNNEAQIAKRGSIIVCKISQDGSKYPEAVDVMGQEEFDKEFKPVDAKLNEIEHGMFTKAEDMSLPDCANVPHVRIDIDNIHDAPHVWIDGERVDDMHGDKKPALTRVYVNWRTDNGSDMQSGKHEFVVQHYELDDTHVPKEIKTGERSITDKDD